MAEQFPKLNPETSDSEDQVGVLVDSPGALATLSQTEIDCQIRTAKNYPRSIQKFQHEALTLATLDRETAGSMFYRVPRDGKYVEGGSVRLAEIVGSAWGNCHVGARVVDIDTKFVTAQAIAWDLEKNFKVVVEIRRGITTKYGKMYSPDMIRTTAQAAMSIALRNAIFRIVSPALVKSVLEKAKEVSLGKDMSMEQRRDRAIKAMTAMGAKLPDLLRVVGKRGIEDLDVDDLIDLQGMHTAIREGETTWAAIVDNWQQSRLKSETTTEPLRNNLPTPASDQHNENAVASPQPQSPPAGQAVQAPRPRNGAPTPDRKLSSTEIMDVITRFSRATGQSVADCLTLVAQHFGGRDLETLTMEELPKLEEILGI